MTPTFEASAQPGAYCGLLRLIAAFFNRNELLRPRVPSSSAPPRLHGIIVAAECRQRRHKAATALLQPSAANGHSCNKSFAALLTP